MGKRIIITEKQLKNVLGVNPSYLNEYLDKNFGMPLKKHLTSGTEMDDTKNAMDYIRDVKNEWLIHFSDNAMKIAYGGFKYATSNKSDLSFTGAGETAFKSSEGYAFAYEVQDVYKYAFARRGLPKYGRDAVLFMASGVKVWHDLDQEEQVIFYNKDAKNLILIQQNGIDNSWFVESVITNKTLVENENIEYVIQWCIDNFQQYRKHLVYGK